MSETIITRRCPSCKEIKPLSEFYKDKRTKDGHYSYCKKCSDTKNKRYIHTPKFKAKRARINKCYAQTEKAKIVRHRYKISEKGREAGRRDSLSEKGRLAKHKYEITHKDIIKERKKQYRRSHRLEICTRACVNARVKCGTLPRPDSFICPCGKPAQEYHHPNGYSKEHRFDIVALCINCHKFFHRKH